MMGISVQRDNIAVQGIFVYPMARSVRKCGLGAHWGFGLDSNRGAKILWTARFESSRYIFDGLRGSLLWQGA